MTQIVRSWNNQRIRQREDGYVCLTDMAKATGKKFSHWNELLSSKRYLEVLSLKLDIPATELIHSIQGGIPENQGTWGHPKVSLRFAQWCSEEFAVQVDEWVDELLTKGTVSIKERESSSTLPLSQVIDLLPAFTKAFQQMTGDEGLGSQIAIGAIAEQHPEISGILESASKKMGLIQAAEDNIMNVTQLADRLNKLVGSNYTAQTLNQLLADKGFQYKDKKQWNLTELGKEFGRQIPYAKQKHKGWQIKWFDSLLPELIK